MPWWAWILIILVVVTLLAGSVGRWLQSKGSAAERNRD